MIYLVLLTGIAAVSFASILIKLCDAPALVIASYRLAISSLFFLAVAGFKRVNPFSVFSQRDVLLAVISGLFLCLHFSTWITSLKYTSVANSVVLVSTSPIFVALGSFIFLKEKIFRLQLVGILVTLLGTFILSSSRSGSAENEAVGNGLALMGAVGGAGYFLLGRHLRARVDTLSYVSVVYSSTAVFLILLTMSLNFSFFDYEPRIYGLFVLIALVPQVIGHTSFNFALKHVSAIMVSVATLGEPIGASLLAFLLLGEKITAFQAVGGSLILTGVALAIRGESKKISE
jgi:drug/metabolite transporter (DMT)-like permease